jgi:ABC-2 type transport system ATP-binding protein
MIEVSHLSKRYGRVLAVDDISFEVPRGRICGFLGPNGAGKSTTMKILTCYHPASSGRATVAGHDVLSESMEVRRRTGYMPEAVPLYPEMRVREFLKFRASLRGVPRRQRRSAIDRVCEKCWLSSPEDMTRRRLGELSRGYRQRVGLAEVLLHDPPVLVLDEPTIGLDPAQIRSMREMIRSLGHEHTILLSSHILAEVEQTCEMLIIIAGGRIAATGTSEELRKRVLGPSRIIAELAAGGEDLRSKLRQLPGVREIDCRTDGEWSRVAIQADPDSDPRGALAEMSCRQGWKLRELRREVASLEDYFVQITYRQNLRESMPPAR